MTQKICGRHSHDLLDMIKRKGLMHLVNNDPKEVERRTKAWLLGIASRQEFDPYIIAVLEIYNKASEIIGHELERVSAEGRVPCPLCAVTRALQDAGADVKWIDNCTDAVLVAAEVNELTRKH